MLHRLSAVIRRQWREARKGGPRVVWNTALALLGLPLSPVIVLVVRLLRPIVLIRLGKLISVRIGHLIGNTEIYLCEKDAGMHGADAVDVFYPSQAVCNYQLDRMWRRVLWVSPLVGFADALNRRVPGGRAHVIPMRHDIAGDRDIHGLLSSTPPHLFFTPEEQAQGEEALRRMGVPEGAPFVCFAARDSAYLDQAVVHGRAWRYHDYRDADIANYLPAVRALTERGWFALRMGAVVARPLAADMPRIVDYATLYRAEFLDLYLLSRCAMFLGDTAGIYSMAMAFRRPMVLVNYIPLQCLPDWGVRDLFIPKTLRRRATGRLLTVREIVDEGGEDHGWWSTDAYEQRGIDAIENTAEEIADAVAEMDARLEGTWRNTDEDEALQARFWSLVKDVPPPNQVFSSRIGACFLRKYRALLD